MVTTTTAVPHVSGHRAPRPRRRTAGYPAYTPYVFLLPTILLFAVFTCYPYVSALWLSLTTNTGGDTAFAGLANGTFLFCLPGSTSACRAGWEKIICAQLDARTTPCNLATLRPRLKE